MCFFYYEDTKDFIVLQFITISPLLQGKRLKQREDFVTKKEPKLCSFGSAFSMV